MSRQSPSPIASFSIASSAATLTPPKRCEVEPLVQIFSRGFTGGMYGGREGRDYVTRTQPDNRGIVLGDGRRIRARRVDRRRCHAAQDRRRLGLRGAGPRRRSDDRASASPPCVRCHLGPASRGRRSRRARASHAGWTVVRTSEAELLENARASYASLPAEIRAKKSRLDVRLFGAAGTPLKAVFIADGETVTVRSEITLSPASKRPLDVTVASRSARPPRRHAVRARLRSTSPRSPRDCSFR